MNDQAALPMRPPHRDDYIPIVKGLRPLCDGEELELRSSLLMMRDRAMATKPRACDASWHLLDVVEREASEAALSHLYQLDDLRALRKALVWTSRAARDLDMLYQPRLPGLDKGEADARG